jgi:hypothetical protein
MSELKNIELQAHVKLDAIEEEEQDCITHMHRHILGELLDDGCRPFAQLSFHLWNTNMDCLKPFQRDNCLKGIQKAEFCHNLLRQQMKQLNTAFCTYAFQTGRQKALGVCIMYTFLNTPQSYGAVISSTYVHTEFCQHLRLVFM